MAHLNQERWSKLVDAKLRNVLVTRDNMIFNNRYEGNPKAGKVKIPVRDTEVAVKTYNKATGVDLDAGSTAYIDLAIDQDEAVNELIDGYDAASVPDGIVAERLDSAGYSMGSIMAMQAEVLMLDDHFIKQGDLAQELVQSGVVGRIAGFNVFESNNMDFESTTRVASKKTTTEFIAGHPNWCHRVMEWQVGVQLQDLNGSGKFIGASAVQGRKVYGIKVSKPQTLYIKRVEAAVG